MKYRWMTWLAVVGLVATSCKRDKQEVIASGMFETTEVVVSAQSAGVIEELALEEGDRVNAGALLGYVDTTQLYLQKMLLYKNRAATQTHLPNVTKQIAALKESIANAKTEQLRVSKLFAGDAATQKQVDDTNAQVKILEGQLAALENNLSINISSIDAQSSAIDIQIAQVEDLLQKAHIVNPITGVVLAKYAEQGEFAVAGKPLYKVANPDTVKLKAYFTGDQLFDLKLGSKLTVASDYGDNERLYEGEIVWISDVAEFTPKTIQTKNQRANLVYAVKIAVKNDGYLKMGMYGDVVDTK